MLTNVRFGVLSGLVVAGVGVAVGMAVHGRWSTVSAHAVAVAVGIVLANTARSIAPLEPGLALAAKTVLRWGVVLVGFRLSVGELAALGPGTLAGVVAVVAITFFGIRRLGRRLGLDDGLSLLVAVGFSICGASAIAAARPISRASDEDVGYAVGLVALCGTLAIWVLPLLGTLIGLDDARFGAWVGASVHDVGQVVAAASTRGDDATAIAAVVKLVRVTLLAPLLALLVLTVGRQPSETDGPRAALIPWFVVLFLGAAAVRSTGLVPDAVLTPVKTSETLLLATGMVGLGAQVRIARLRTIGSRPLALGLIGWVLVASVALVATGW